MASEQGKLYAAKQAYNDAETKQSAAREDDQSLDAKRHDRAYNPINDAESGMVSDKLNQDSGRYRKGPGPF